MLLTNEVIWSTVHAVVMWFEMHHLSEVRWNTFHKVMVIGKISLFCFNRPVELARESDKRQVWAAGREVVLEMMVGKMGEGCINSSFEALNSVAWVQFSKKNLIFAELISYLAVQSTVFEFTWQQSDPSQNWVPVQLNHSTPCHSPLFYLRYGITCSICIHV